MDISFVDNKLILPTAKLSFKHNIYSVAKIKGGVAVLLDIPTNSQEVDNLYAIDLNGQKLWRVQSVKEFNPQITRLSPYVGITLLKNGNILATNFFGLSYEVSFKNGTLLSSRMTK